LTGGFLNLGFLGDDFLNKVKVKGRYITLAQLLKLSGIVDTGGQAKYAILDRRVKVNGEIVLQRGKKLFPGDVVIVDDRERIEVT
jgi:ribosome-associated protein